MYVYMCIAVCVCTPYVGTFVRIYYCDLLRTYACMDSIYVNMYLHAVMHER